MTLTAEPASLAAVTDFVRKGALEANLPEERIGELELVIEEILMNLSLYAYPSDSPGEVLITYSVPVPGELRLEIADQGREFDPLTASAPDLTLDLTGRPVGGLGIFLIRSFASALAYRREDGWNRLAFAILANP